VADPRSTKLSHYISVFIYEFKIEIKIYHIFYHSMQLICGIPAKKLYEHVPE
jgi:hypothetical protein